jgi:hypothetical protein
MGSEQWRTQEEEEGRRSPREEMGRYTSWDRPYCRGVIQLETRKLGRICFLNTSALRGRLTAPMGLDGGGIPPLICQVPAMTNRRLEITNLRRSHNRAAEATVFTCGLAAFRHPDSRLRT